MILACFESVWSAAELTVNLSELTIENLAPTSFDKLEHFLLFRGRYFYSDLQKTWRLIISFCRFRHEWISSPRLMIDCVLIASTRGQFNKPFTSVIYKCSYSELLFQRLKTIATLANTCKSFIELTPGLLTFSLADSSLASVWTISLLFTVTVLLAIMTLCRLLRLVTQNSSKTEIRSQNTEFVLSARMKSDELERTADDIQHHVFPERFPGKQWMKPHPRRSMTWHDRHTD